MSNLLLLQLAIGMPLAISMIIKPRYVLSMTRRLKNPDFVGHFVVGIYCYYVLTDNPIFLFLIFVLIETIQKLFFKRNFGHNDIVYSMYAVAILYFIHKFICNDAI